MNTIQLEGNVSFEQYQMAVNVLKAIGLKVKRQNIDDTDFLLSDEQKKELDRRLKLDKSHFRPIDEFMNELKVEYGL